MAEDKISHVTAAGGLIRGLAALTTHAVEEARSRHGSYPTATAALGRTMTAAAILGADLKGSQKVMIEVIGDGPLGRVVAEVEAEGSLRAYVRNPQVHLPLNRHGKLDVAGAVGQGSFYVTKDLSLNQPYRGMIPLISGEIGEDFAYYLQQSEQTPSAVAVGVLVDSDNSVRASGGLAIQLLPGGAEETELVEEIERRVQSMPMISRAIDNGMPPIELVMGILKGFDPKVIGERTLDFNCPCSKERFSRGLIALGKDEVMAMITEDEGAEAICNFCNERYQFTVGDLYGLIKEID